MHNIIYMLYYVNANSIYLFNFTVTGHYELTCNPVVLFNVQGTTMVFACGQTNGSFQFVAAEYNNSDKDGVLTPSQTVRPLTFLCVVHFDLPQLP